VTGGTTATGRLRAQRAASGSLRGPCTVSPPSTTRICRVVKDPAGEARHATVSAISVGRAKRPRGSGRRSGRDPTCPRRPALRGVHPSRRHGGDPDLVGGPFDGERALDRGRRAGRPTRSRGSGGCTAAARCGNVRGRVAPPPTGPRRSRTRAPWRRQMHGSCPGIGGRRVRRATPWVSNRWTSTRTRYPLAATVAPAVGAAPRRCSSEQE
jgi:hypothetical protein